LAKYGSHPIQRIFLSQGLSDAETLPCKTSSPILSLPHIFIPNFRIPEMKTASFLQLPAGGRFLFTLSKGAGARINPFLEK
jgi:hypothetical protein